MKNAHIRLVIILGAIAVVGMVTIQAFWVIRAFNLKEKEFSHKVNLALKKVSEQMASCSNTQVTNLNPVNKVSSSYYLVNVNDFINPKKLEGSLRKEFKKREIEMDFEYAIYDCSHEQLVYGSYVNLDVEDNYKARASFPRLDRNDYYFGVHFPNKIGSTIAEMGIWSFTTLMMVVVIIFFVYAMAVILRQKRLSEIQKDFINNMTHEFKTPISTISISSEVLNKPDIIKSPARLSHYTAIIKEEADRLKNQVERVLQMATTDKHKVKLSKEKVSVEEILMSSVKQINNAHKECDFNIKTDFLSTESTVNADRLHLTNVFYNLLDNALKYCEKRPTIKLKTFNQNSNVCIEVTDNGIGIGKDEISKIFKKFYRVPTGNVHDVKGFGIGLNYVKTMIEAHRGKINIQSGLGSGSCFTVQLPLA
ncbi:MAG: HAMP domain-containing sensor histidine kinase [Bacteroidota bacterium]